jgi:Zn-dependent peptidase ImmA (M78 family)/transcriptional regulator with XRE-family HTH domain
MNELIGRRIKYAREKAGLTQAQLSDKLGFNDRQTLAAIEAGQRKVAADELLQVMDVFGVDLDFFTDSFRVVGEAKFSWRASQDIAAKTLQEFEERAGGWIAMYRRLGEMQGVKTQLLQYRLSLTERNSFEDAMAAAETLVVDWKLGPQPALKLENAIRANLGTLVLYVDAPSGISGAACNVSGLNTILINRNESVGRRNFDLAHECFHLLTWEQMQPQHRERVDASQSGKGKYKRIEQMADNFAAALLMPEKVLNALWQKRGALDINAWLNQTASIFFVTFRALKWRLINLGWLSKSDRSAVHDTATATSAYPKGIKEKPKLFCIDFVSRLHTGLEKGQISVRRAAALLFMKMDDLAKLLTDYERPVPFEV